MILSLLHSYSRRNTVFSQSRSDYCSVELALQLCVERILADACIILSFLQHFVFHSFLFYVNFPFIQINLST